MHISDGDYTNFGRNNKPGLYRVIKNKTEWELLNQETVSISTKNVVINGLCEEKRQVAKKVLPDMIENAYGNRTGINSIWKEGYTLFFNPQTEMDDRTPCHTHEKKCFNNQYTLELLANVIKQSQLDEKKVQWTIHGNGAELFGKAIKQLQGTTLDKHEVLFLSPTSEANIPDILSDMHNTKMKLHEKIMQTNEDDWTSIKNKVMPRTEAIADIGHLFSTQNHLAAAVIRVKGRARSVQLIQIIKALAIHGISALFKLKDYRNLNNSNFQLTNPVLNPHFHPFKDQIAFKCYYKRASNSLIKAEALTKLFKRIQQMLTNAKN